MKYIKRTLVDSVIFASQVRFENDQVVAVDLPHITVFNEIVDEEKAIKILQKKYGKLGQYAIRYIDTTERKYQISVEDFVKNATLILSEDVSQDDELVEAI